MQASVETGCGGSDGDVQLVAGALGMLVTLSGEHDLATRVVVHRTLRRATESGGDVLVDLSAATFFDVSLLSELVECEARLESSGGCVHVRTGSRRSSRIFEIAGLDRFLEPGRWSADPT